MVYDVAILGAGASGLFVGAHLRDKNVCLIDHQPKVAQKIKVSGGGKCNITNAYMSPDHFLGDQQFTAFALKKYDEKALLSFFTNQGVHPSVNPRVREGQYFFKTSDEPITVLKQRTRHHKLFLNEAIKTVVHPGEHFVVTTEKKSIQAKRVVVALGGMSFSQIGGSDLGFKIAQTFGHTVVPPKPALVGLTVQPEQFWFKSLSGLSIDVRVHVNDHKVNGALLFTHKGISGPAVLTTSLYWDKGTITIDFLPQQELSTLFNPSKKLLSTATKLPKRFILAFLEAIGVSDKPVNQLTKEDKEHLEQLKNYRFAPAGTVGFSKAEVTKGGVSTNEVDAKTMESKKQKGLYFIGEVLNVTGELGGYNFQWAFSSAMMCVKELNNVKL
jgi:predicted Rossmann fold flavoprotein